jgi:hypothetical protein
MLQRLIKVTIVTPALVSAVQSGPSLLFGPFCGSPRRDVRWRMRGGRSPGFRAGILAHSESGDRQARTLSGPRRPGAAVGAQEVVWS